MILAAATGFGLDQFTDLEGAVIPAILIGMVAALFVPTKGGCAVNLPNAAAKSGGDSPG